MTKWVDLLKNSKAVSVLLELYYAQPLSRDKLPYSKHFETMYEKFLKMAKIDTDRRNFWLTVLALGKQQKLARDKANSRENKQSVRKGFFN